MILIVRYYEKDKIIKNDCYFNLSLNQLIFIRSVLINNFEPFHEFENKTGYDPGK